MAIETIETFPGDVGFYARRLSDGRTLCFQEDKPLVAASVIKIPIMVAAFYLAQRGEIDLDRKSVV